ncbi:MAG: IS5 family transposase [Dehalococcoidia bacterium]|nr:IS5 family transposase [Dehalococcoidia bacterium]
MRGRAVQQTGMLFGVTTEEFIPERHPIRRIRVIIDDLLARLSPELTSMYAPNGRYSVPPERLIKATLLMAFYSIRSERQFCERLQYDLLFKWFLGLNINDPAFDHSTFSKNRKRLMEHGLATALLGEAVREARKRRLVSEDHFSADGTLLQAWASQKSLRPRSSSTEEQGPPAGGGGRNPDADFRGERRTNETHVSTTDPEARLARKGPGFEAKLTFAGHLLMENRNGLILDVLVTQAAGTAEREAALAMLDRRKLPRRRATLAADRGYDTKAFVEELRQRGVTPHIARNTSGRRSAIDARTTHHPGYAKSLRFRKRIEECFGWIKTVGGGRKLRYIGQAKNQLWATFTAIGFNLVRMSNLEAQAT